MGKRFKETKKVNHKLKNTKRLVGIILIFLMAAFIYFCFTNSEKIINMDIVKDIQAYLLAEQQTVEENLPREKLNFNYGWQFSKGEGYDNKGSASADEVKVTVIPSDSTVKPYESNYEITESGVGLNNEIWENVSLPHTYNDIDTFDTFNETGGLAGQNGERTMYTGTSWYKKTFTIPAEYEGKRIYIEFEAARQAAKIYVNGNPVVGTSENGFIAFGYDLTEHINYGGENEITVMVDNSFEYTIEGTSSTIPWNDSHWHPTYGGLYRNSYLYILDDLHLTLPLYSFLETEGTYIYTSDETDTTAKIHVNAQIENSSSQKRTFSYIAQVKDMDGNTVLEMRSDNQVLESGEKKIFILADTLQNAIRWSDDYPYLYTVVCKIEENGVVVDNNENEIGIRTVRYTTDGGMYLNENYTILNGWGQKSTNEWAGLGSAYPDWMQDYVISLMKDAGANYIRYGHTAGGASQISAANKYGIMVLQPGVDSEGQYEGSYSEASYLVRQNAFRDMIIYFRNNPSIIMWELGNQSNIEESCMQALYDIVKQYDYGNRGQLESFQIESGTSVDDSSQIVSEQNLTNYGTYNDTTTQSDRLIAIRQGNATAKKYVEIEESTEGDTISMGGLPVIEGEYNRLEARRGVWDTYTKGYEDFKNSTTASGFANVDSEVFAVEQVKKYATIISDPRMNGVANWIFSDTNSHGRLSSEVCRASGEVDAVMLPKESYWVCKTMFSKEPGVHIIGHWNYPDNTKKSIYVVAKGAASVELFLNDESIQVNSSPTSLYLYTFENVTYKKGTLKAVAKDIDGNIIAQDTVKTDNEPVALKITPIVSEDGLLANGSDILLLDVEVVDSEGNRCESFDGIRDGIITEFTINDENGCSIWRGGYNSSIENSTNNKYLYIESGITRVAIRTTMIAGDITVTATAKNLESATATTNDSEGDTTTETTKGLKSATITVASKAVDNTNGYCTTLSSNLTYSIAELEYVGYGDGTKKGNVYTNAEVNQSELIRSLYYTGENKAVLERPLGEGKLLYADLTDTFDSVPYKMMNAEYIMLNNSNNGDTATDLLNFVAKKEINVYILRDPAVIKPVWIDKFTKQDDIVTTTDGMIYDVYMKTFNTGDLINLGNNSTTGAEGQKGRMYIVCVKEKSKVDNGVFYYEDFSDTSLTSNWEIVEMINTQITYEDETTNRVARFQDTNTTGIAYMYSEFAKLYDKFTFSYRLKLDGSVATNKWIRTFLWKDPVESFSASEKKDNILFEVYANRDTSYLTYYNSTETTNLLPIPLMDQWYVYNYEIDVKNKTFDASITTGSEGTDFTLSRKLDYANNIQIGTGNSSLNNFWIDDISITPISRKIIEGIKVNGVDISEFHELTKDYRAKGYNNSIENNTIEVLEGDDFSSKTIEYLTDHVKLTVSDSKGNTQEFHIYFDDSIDNKTELRSLISKASGLNSVNYSELTWQAMQIKKEEAESISASEFILQTQVDKITQELKQKIKELELISVNI